MVPGHEAIRDQYIGFQGGIPTILLTWFLDMKQLETSGLEFKEVFPPSCPAYMVPGHEAIRDQRIGIQGGIPTTAYMVPGHEAIRDQRIGIQGGIPTVLLTWFLDMKQLETSGLGSKEVFPSYCLHGSWTWDK
jgi:hypothetical protein